MRLDVKKTYKLFIAGKFPRSESGRSYQVKDSKANHVANVALASRKDVRDAVQAARAAQPGWVGASAYNRGQVPYRIAEMLGPVLEELSDEMSDKLIIAKHNIDDAPNTPTKYGVRGIPTMLLFKGGQLLDSKVGAANKSNIKEWLDTKVK